MALGWLWGGSKVALGGFGWQLHHWRSRRTPEPRLDCLDTKTAWTSAFFLLPSSFPPDYLDGARFRIERGDVEPESSSSVANANNSRAPHRQIALLCVPYATSHCRHHTLVQSGPPHPKSKECLRKCGGFLSKTAATLKLLTERELFFDKPPDSLDAARVLPKRKAAQTDRPYR
jgi:hypothetical protein